MTEKESVLGRNGDISNKKVLRKAFTLGLKIKEPFSLVISILGFPMALLPLALCRQLQRMTDILFDLSSKPENIRSAFSVFGAICILFFVQLLYRLLDDFAGINDRYDTQLFIKE